MAVSLNSQRKISALSVCLLYSIWCFLESDRYSKSNKKDEKEGLGNYWWPWTTGRWLTIMVEALKSCPPRCCHSSGRSRWKKEKRNVHIVSSLIWFCWSHLADTLCFFMLSCRCILSIYLVPREIPSPSCSPSWNAQLEQQCEKVASFLVPFTRASRKDGVQWLLSMRASKTQFFFLLKKESGEELRLSI